MAITFDHAVKYNGKYYPANTPIEEAKKTPWKYEGPETSDEEAAQKAAQDGQNAAQQPAEGEGEANTNAKPKAAQKAAKTRKKGDA